MENEKINTCAQRHVSCETSPELGTLVQQASTVCDLYAERFGIDRDATWYLAKLTEELGELQAAYLATKGAQRGAVSENVARQNLEDEAADLFGFLLVFAEWQGIDLADAFANKWGRHLPPAVE